MDPMDSVLVMVFVISVASGMVHPEEVDWAALWRPLSAFLKFWYTWLYRSAQALCQNAGRINPSFAAVQQKVETTTDKAGNVTHAATETAAVKEKPSIL